MNNAQLRAALEETHAALSEVMEWIANWSPSFTYDSEWAATETRAKLALEIDPNEGPAAEGDETTLAGEGIAASEVRYEPSEEGEADE